MRPTIRSSASGISRRTSGMIRSASRTAAASFDGASSAPVNSTPERSPPSGAKCAASTPFGIVTTFSDGVEPRHLARVLVGDEHDGAERPVRRRLPAPHGVLLRAPPHAAPRRSPARPRRARSSATRPAGRSAPARRARPRRASRASRARRRTRACRTRRNGSGEPPRVDRLAECQRAQHEPPTHGFRERRERHLVQLDPLRRGPVLIGPAQREHVHVVARARGAWQSSCRTRREPFERCPRRLRGADEDAHRGHVGSMCGLHRPITAAVVSPLLPEPPVTGGQKRTLRLLEAMERAGLHPHVLTADPGEPGAVERLRARGWEVDVMVEPPPGAVRPAAPARRAGCRARCCISSPAASREVASRAALVQFEHTQSAYYAAPAGVPSILSLHNLDSAVARSAARQRAARQRGLAARAQPRGRAAGRRAARAPARRPRAVRLRGGRRRGVPRRRARAARAQRRRRRVLRPAAGRLRRARAVLRPLRLRGRTGAASSASWPRAGRSVLHLRPGARLAIAGGGMDEALRMRLDAVEGVEVLGLGRRPAGRAGRARARWSSRSGRAAGRG